MASQNQFAWMQSGELHMTMGKSSNAASVPLDTRYGFFCHVLTISIYVFNQTKLTIPFNFMCRNHKDANQDEVEVMSTDSSSTSSSDSQ